MDRYEHNVLFDHTKLLRGERSVLSGPQERRAYPIHKAEQAEAQATTEEKIRRSLADVGFTSTQIAQIIQRDKDSTRKQISKGEGAHHKRTRESLAHAGFTQRQIDLIVENLKSSPPSSPDDVLETQALVPWFQKCWSTRPPSADASRAIASDRTAPNLPMILTIPSRESIAPREAELAEPFTYQRIRSWRHGPVATTAKLTLKGVVHATYGNFLEDKTYKGANPPGLVAVPQSCKSQGDALFQIL